MAVGILSYLHGYLSGRVGRVVLVGAKETIRTVVYVTSRGRTFRGKIGRGELYNSLVVDVVFVSDYRVVVNLFAAEHVRWILEGRPAHPGDDSKLIPIVGERGRGFRQWSERKGLNAYAVRRSIQKYGIAPLALDSEIANNVRGKLGVIIGEGIIEAYRVVLGRELRDLL